MRNFFIFVILVLSCLAALIFTGWGEHKTWNQKVTIDVETPGGIVSNSTNLTFVYSSYPKRLNSNRYTTLGLYGEAPFVQLGTDQVVFALSLYEVYAIFHEYARHYGIQKGNTEEIIERLLNDPERPTVEGFDKPPFFVFADLNDPSSIRRINHLTFDWRFGNGVNFKSIKYQLTDEPKTKGEVRKVLPWVDGHRGPFVPNSVASGSESLNIPSFNRSILSRHYSCLIDSFMMNNLTYGFYRNGIRCSF